MTNEELVQEYQNGNLLVLNDLIKDNEKIIYYFANKYKGLCSKVNLEFEDLVQEGWCAFIDAASRFQLNENITSSATPFLSYAGTYIKGRILNKINSSIPRMKKNNINSEPLIVNSVNALVLGGDNLTLEDFLVDEHAEEHFYDVIQKEYIKTLRKDLIQLLDDVFGSEFRCDGFTMTGDVNSKSIIEKISYGITGKEVLFLHYGFFGKPMTMREISEKSNVTESYIQYLESKAIRTIRYSVIGQYFMKKYQDEEIQHLQQRKASINKMQSPEKVILQIDAVDDILENFFGKGVMA